MAVKHLILIAIKLKTSLTRTIIPVITYAFTAVQVIQQVMYSETPVQKKYQYISLHELHALYLLLKTVVFVPRLSLILIIVVFHETPSYEALLLGIVSKHPDNEVCVLCVT